MVLEGHIHLLNFLQLWNSFHLALANHNHIHLPAHLLGYPSNLLADHRCLLQHLLARLQKSVEDGLDSILVYHNLLLRLREVFLAEVHRMHHHRLLVLKNFEIPSSFWNNLQSLRSRNWIDLGLKIFQMCSIVFLGIYTPVKLVTPSPIFIFSWEKISFFLLLKN